MAWSEAFVKWLAEPVTYPQFRLEVARVRGYLPGASANISSHPGILGFPSVITARGSRIQAGTLNPGTWDYTTGTATIAMLSDVDLRQELPRGALLRVRMGAAGWDYDAFEPIFLGMLEDVTYSAGQYFIEMRSIVGALTNRFTQVAIQSPLFYTLAQTTISGGAYTAGNTTVNVASTTGLDKLTGGNYLIQVYPDSGDPFFLEGTSKTATTVTVATTAQIGTTAANAANGNAVYLCAFIETDPVAAVLTALTSTGVGDNGSYDTGPASWGLGIDVSDIDLVDCSTTQAIVNPTSGSTAWDVYSTEQQEDAKTWIQSILQPAGMWLCERQGKLTIRAGESEGGFYDVQAIIDDDIVEIRSYSTWSPSQVVEYSAINVQSVTGSVLTQEQALDVRPAVSTIYYLLPYSEQNESAWRTKVIDRLKPFVFRIGEEIEIVCRGWRLAILTPGDGLWLSSRFIDTRSKDDWIAFVTSVQPDWFGCTVTIRCILYPERSEFG